MAVFGSLLTNYKKLNDISRLSQLPISRVDRVLDKLGIGRVFSLFHLASLYHQITVHKDTVLHTAFCPPTGLHDWLVMPQGSIASLDGLSRSLTRLQRAWDKLWRTVSGRCDRARFKPVSLHQTILCPLRATTQAQSQALSLESPSRRD